MTGPSLRDRYHGALLGLACGDALGTAVEFSPRGSFVPVTAMRGGGAFKLQPGQWTDDTSMALCLAESLVQRRGFDPLDQMQRYVNWWRNGYLSSTGICFDIGNATRSALARFEDTGEPFAGSTHPNTAGNGSLMRLAPVVMYFFPRLTEALDYAAASSRTTHAAAEAVDCCRLLAYALSRAFAGVPKEALLEGAVEQVTEPAVQELAEGRYRAKAHREIRGWGYAVAALEASLWCLETTGTLSEAVLAAANLGDDADTTAAITGQLAGAVYGAEAIPSDWLSVLHARSQITNLAEQLFTAMDRT